MPNEGLLVESSAETAPSPQRQSRKARRGPRARGPAPGLLEGLNMINIDQWTITTAVLRAQGGAGNARLREIMDSLVRHLHEFAREVQLTEAEWAAGIDFLTRAGHITDGKRQEFILLSDVLGLSTLVTAQNNSKPAGCTEATVFGPFFVADAPEYRNGDDISNG